MAKKTKTKSKVKGAPARRKTAKPAARIKKASSVKRATRSRNSAIKRAVKKATKRSKHAPGRDRRRAREQKTPKVVKRAAPKAVKKLKALTRTEAVTIDRRGGRALLQCLSGTARAGQWVVEVQPTNDEPYILRASNPFTRAEKAMAAAKRLLPNMEIAGGISTRKSDVSEAAAKGKLATPTGKKVRRALARGLPEIAPGAMSSDLVIPDALEHAVSGVPTSMVSGVPDSEPDQDPDGVFPPTDPRAFTPPAITRDPPIDLNEIAQAE